MGKKIVVLEKRFTVSGTRLPDPIPDGEILTDTKNNLWKIGRSIGFGGFGEIYLASEYNPHVANKNVDSNSQYVIKVEPHSSSTLFVEMNFYLRVATQDKLNEWKEFYKQEVLGMPNIVSFGSHMFHEKLRYLVLPKYGCDIQKKFLEMGRRFHPKTAFTLCYYIIDILEYIHSHGYVHNDIKASNLLLGLKGQAPIYLVDFGLACRYIDKDTGLHKPYCEDERRAHNGTLEYTSRDGHSGAVSRKGDLEILGYNLLQWLVGYLPWEINLSDPERVATLKKRAMGHINDFVSRCYIKDSPPGALIDYLKYINSLNFDSNPDYKYCKKLFRLGVQQSGYKFDKVLSFDTNYVPLTKVKSIKRLQSEIENIMEESPRKVFIINNSIKTPELRIPCNVQDYNRITRHSATESQIQSNKKFDWVKVLQSNPEEMFKIKQKERLNSERSCENLTSCDDFFDMVKKSNPTYAMLEQMEIMRQRQLAEQNGDDTFDSDEGSTCIGDTNNNSPSVKKRKKCLKRSLSHKLLGTPRRTRSKSKIKTPRRTIQGEVIKSASTTPEKRKFDCGTLSVIEEKQKKSPGKQKKNSHVVNITPEKIMLMNRKLKTIKEVNPSSQEEKPRKSVGRPKKINISELNDVEKESTRPVDRPRKSVGRPKKINISELNDVEKEITRPVDRPRKSVGRPKKINISEPNDVENEIKRPVGRPRNIKPNETMNELVNNGSSPEKKSSRKMKKVQSDSCLKNGKKDCLRGLKNDNKKESQLKNLNKKLMNVLRRLTDKNSDLVIADLKNIAQTDRLHRSRSLRNL